MNLKPKKPILPFAPPNKYRNPPPGWWYVHNQNPIEKMRNKARRKVRTALASKKIKKLDCIVCGHWDVQAHHIDYSKPLEIRWLCKACHRLEHKGDRKHEHTNRTKNGNLGRE